MSSLFLEGLLSFFSPCVLPLVPLYIGYLTKDAQKTDEQGNVTYARGRTFIATAAFVLGICTVFVLAGLGSGVLHDFFTANTVMFQLITGFLLVLFGLFGLHIIRIPLLERTYQMKVNVSAPAGFLRAWIMGFGFSFAWSPCIGPMLAQALVLAASAENKAAGWMYIASYAAGFIVIFLMLGLFTSEVLNFLKKYRNAVKYTEMLSGLIVLCVGIWTLSQGFATVHALQKRTGDTVVGEVTETADAEQSDVMTIEELNFTLKDAAGVSHQLTDYKGKTVLLNFFGTWCYYCNMELPGLQEVQNTRDDVTVVLVAAPGVNGEGDIASVEKTMSEAGYTMQILYDETLEVTGRYGISGYPTTFIFCPDGTLLGYAPGYISDEQLQSALDEAGTYKSE